MFPQIISALAPSIFRGETGNIFGTVLDSVFNRSMRGRTEQGQGTALERSTTSMPQETQASGVSESVAAPIFAPKIEIGTAQPMQRPVVNPQTAGFGGLVGPLTTLGRKYLPEIFGGALVGGALATAPTILDQFGQPKKLRVTKKLKSQVKKAVELMGLEATAEAMGVDIDTVIYILMKKMRNDGPYVTKAAVRKTRQTVRKMKTLCDMYDDLRPAAKRRAPMRKAATTRITQVK